MAKNHLKRIAMPTTWTTQLKKGINWVSTVNPGAHSEEEGMPLVLALREILKIANTARETKHILNHKNIMIDGVRRKDYRFNLGLMDVLSMPEVKENYRVSLTNKGKLSLIKIDDKESKSKICKIKGKGLYKGKTQLQLSDGRNILVEKKSEYSTQDSVIISLPDQKITSHIKFEKGAFVLLTNGKKIGSTGTLEEIKGDSVRIKSKEGEFETLKKYCLVVGKQKPSLTIE